MDIPYVPSMMSVLATTNIISQVFKQKTMDELIRNSKLKSYFSVQLQPALLGVMIIKNLKPIIP